MKHVAEWVAYSSAIVFMIAFTVFVLAGITVNVIGWARNRETSKVIAESARVAELEKALARAAYVAEHLHSMIDKGTWRASDLLGVIVAAEIKGWAALSCGDVNTPEGGDPEGFH